MFKDVNQFIFQIYRIIQQVSRFQIKKWSALASQIGKLHAITIDDVDKGMGRFISLLVTKSWSLKTQIRYLVKFAILVPTQVQDFQTKLSRLSLYSYTVLFTVLIVRIPSLNSNVRFTNWKSQINLKFNSILFCSKTNKTVSI